MPAVPVRRLPFTLTETSVLAIIPARYHSTRLPGKPLVDIAGQPMVVHVLNRARQASLVDAVVVATDDPRIVQAVEAAGGVAWLTRPDHPSGTDRLAEVARELTCGIVVNVQGDEPLLDAEDIDAAIRPLRATPGIEMGTIGRPLAPGDHENPNVVKVVRRLDGRALYFSRAPIPHYRDGGPAPAVRSASSLPSAPSVPSVQSVAPVPSVAPVAGDATGPAVLAHVGLYAYRRDTLLRLAGLAPTALERAESLEQLRALEHGIDITVVPTNHDGIGVDTPEDLERVRQRLLAGATPA
ncbi:MAG: 3-deoxy-manno-octulosonate cytidylyltransferase [Vicinamibacterales bacterium]